MIPFALETLPVHYTGVPQGLWQDAEDWAGASQKSRENHSSKCSLRFWHRRRLSHSCRKLGFFPPSLWPDCELPPPKIFSGDISERFIYSIRYFDSEESKEAGKKELNGEPVDQGENWVLLRRKNLYCFELSPGDDSLPPWAWVPRVGLSSRSEAGAYGPLWNAKCHWQSDLLKKLHALQGQSLYAGCEDILRWVWPFGCPAPLLLEGMKSNVFLFRYQQTALGDELHLYTPRVRKIGGNLLCGTTRNWLCYNGPRLPGVKVFRRDVTLSDMLCSDGLLICNAAMGLRWVRKLVFPPGMPCGIPDGHSYSLPVRGVLRRLFAMYWNAVF
ncbi:MAG: aminotransferase class IV [Spirochaetota bacterium]